MTTTTRTHDCGRCKQTIAWTAIGWTHLETGTPDCAGLGLPGPTQRFWDWDERWLSDPTDRRDLVRTLKTASFQVRLELKNTTAPPLPLSTVRARRPDVPSSNVVPVNRRDLLDVLETAFLELRAAQKHTLVSEKDLHARQAGEIVTEVQRCLHDRNWKRLHAWADCVRATAEATGNLDAVTWELR